jgi:hypothetical protein
MDDEMTGTVRTLRLPGLPPSYKKSAPLRERLVVDNGDNAYALNALESSRKPTMPESLNG